MAKSPRRRFRRRRHAKSGFEWPDLRRRPSAGHRATRAPPGCRSVPDRRPIRAQQLPARLRARDLDDPPADARPTLRYRAGGDASERDTVPAGAAGSPRTETAPRRRGGLARRRLGSGCFCCARPSSISLRFHPRPRARAGRQGRAGQRSRQDSRAGKSKPTSTLSPFPRAAIEPIGEQRFRFMASPRILCWPLAMLGRSQAIQMLSRPFFR